MRLLLVLIVMTFSHMIAEAQTADDYEWRNVPIGSGGYISGMRIHPMPPYHKYLRTDVGGAYRRNEEAGRLEQLFDFGPENKDFYSVAGITFVPSDPNSVILAVGRTCEADASAILVSTDRGENWEVIEVPFYFAANGGRNCSGNDTDKDREGNCIEVDPLDHTRLYIGTRDQGLWVLDLDDPQHPTQVPSTGIPHNTDRSSIRSVIFHPVQQHLVFIGYAGYGVYMGNTSDGSWQKIDDDLPSLSKTNDLSLSASGDALYAACREDGIYRCADPTSDARVWEPVLSYTGNDRGYLTVSCSPHEEDKVMTVQNNWASLDDLRVSVDGGENWATKNATLENIFPWKSSGFGSNPSQIVFHPDPAKADRLYLTAFFGSYMSMDHTTATIDWSNEFNRGHEEVVATEMTAFPSNSAGNFLLLQDADHTGFIYTDISMDNFPTFDIRSLLDDGSNTVKGGTSTFAESDADRLVVCLPRSWNDDSAAIAYSSDGGVSFQRSTTYDETWGKSVMAISATDPDRLLVANESGLYWEDIGSGNGFTQALGTSSVSNDCGTLEFSCQGPSTITDDVLINMSVFSSHRPLEADRTMGCVFYFYDQFSGTFHVSTDSGETWCQVNDDLPVVPSVWTHKIDLTSLPGQAGLLFLNFNDGLLKSTDGGQSWTTDGSVQNALLLGFGKERPGQNVASLYLYGRANGDPTMRAYHSWDAGNTWTAISDPSVFNIGDPQLMTGDRNVYGQVYMGSGGQGVFVGEFGADLGCAADINGDGLVNVADFLILNSDFGTACVDCASDINGDGVVDIDDFLVFNSDFGTACD